MIHMCAICEKELLDGDYAQVAARGTYHRLDSKVAYAFEAEDFDLMPESLAHVECIEADYPIVDEDEDLN
jgi:hypothetical protein